MIRMTVGMREMQRIRNLKISYQVRIQNLFTKIGINIGISFNTLKQICRPAENTLTSVSAGYHGY